MIVGPLGGRGVIWPLSQLVLKGMQHISGRGVSARCRCQSGPSESPSYITCRYLSLLGGLPHLNSRALPWLAVTPCCYTLLLHLDVCYRPATPSDCAPYINSWTSLLQLTTLP